eukprot:1825077-Rhodomonas_salina.1
MVAVGFQWMATVEAGVTVSMSALHSAPHPMFQRSLNGEYGENHVSALTEWRIRRKPMSQRSLNGKYGENPCLGAH